MGTTVLPSVKARTETSGPVRNSSMTTRLPLSPKTLSSIMDVHGVLGLLPGLGDEHALAQGQTVRLDHHGDGGGLQIGQRRGRIGRTPA